MSILDLPPPPKKKQGLECSLVGKHISEVASCRSAKTFPFSERTSLYLLKYPNLDAQKNNNFCCWYSLLKKLKIITFGKPGFNPILHVCEPSREIKMACATTYRKKLLLPDWQLSFPSFLYKGFTKLRTSLLRNQGFVLNTLYWKENTVQEKVWSNGLALSSLPSKMWYLVIRRDISIEALAFIWRWTIILSSWASMGGHSSLWH